MTRHISVATVIEKNRISSEYAFVILVEIDVIDTSTNLVQETLYVARNSEDIVWQGITWTATNFEFEAKEEAGEVPEIKATFVDITRSIQARVDQYGGGAGFVVRMHIVNTGNLNQPPEYSQKFWVLKSTVQEYEVSFTLGAQNPLRQRFPRRIQYRDRCSWRYKSVECGYTGALPTCDFTLQGPNGCAAHNNTRRFGGFPGLKIT